MLPYASLLTLNRYDAQPLYQQLAARLVQQIRRGTLAPGERVPSTRQMSTLLGLHRAMGSKYRRDAGTGPE